MTKKLILALLAQSVAMSDSPCAPEMPVASGNSWFGVGVDMGAAFVHGSVSQNVTDTSDTSTSKDEQKQVLNGGLLYLAPEIENLDMNPVDSFKSNTGALKSANPEGFVENVDMQTTVGYLRLVPNTSVASYKNSKVAVDFGGVPFNMADSSKKTPSTSAGFVGQLSFHYMTKIPETMMTVGLHAGIGYNGARSSLKMPMQTVNTSAPYTQNIKTADVGYSNQGNAAAYTRQYVAATGFTDDVPNGVKLLNKDQAEAVKVDHKISKEFADGWVVTGDDNPPYVSYNSDSAHLYGQASTEGKDAEDRVPVQLDGENLGAFTQSKKNTDINSKATISSGFMLQAGTRLGAMIGNVFPHIRVGWAAYQLKAHITNQTCLNSGVDKEKSYSTKYEGNAAAIGGNGLGLKIANAEVTIEQTKPHYLGQPEYASATNPRTISSNNGTFSGKLIPDVGSDLSTRTVHSKYKWANALTLGAGIDWAYQNMTFGLYYQAAICQKVNFDNWKSDIVTGAPAVTSLSKAEKPKEVAAEYNGIATMHSSGVVTAVAAKSTEGTSKVNYTTSQPETVSMSPVFNTVMLSVKYCFKAA
jgi:hypothetical protein